ncbi:MAG: hypothetical protein IJY39_07995 [Clostridia bacterium]|nr:hypothetical protein [Clostridia bacterium]
MKEYIITVITVGLVGSVITTLTPEGEGGGIGRTVRFAVGLVLIAVCISPILSMIQGLKELDLQNLIPRTESVTPEYESIFEGNFLSAELEQTESGIARMLSERFDIAEDEIRVSVSVTEEADGGRRLKRIFVTLYGSAIWKDTGAMEGYLQELFGCEVVTAIG